MAGHKYAVLIPKRVAKQIRAVPEPARKRIVDKIEALAANPRPPGCEKLSDQEQYRIRVGEYRIVYSIEDRQVIIAIARVQHRRNVYRN
jgi:mRNA interferase RelE/StbE